MKLDNVARAELRADIREIVGDHVEGRGYYWNYDRLSRKDQLIDRLAQFVERKLEAGA